MKESYFLLFII